MRSVFSLVRWLACTFVFEFVCEAFDALSSPPRDDTMHRSPYSAERSLLPLEWLRKIVKSLNGCLRAASLRALLLVGTSGRLKPSACLSAVDAVAAAVVAATANSLKKLSGAVLQSPGLVSAFFLGSLGAGPLSLPLGDLNPRSGNDRDAESRIFACVVVLDDDDRGLHFQAVSSPVSTYRVTPVFRVRSV